LRHVLGALKMRFAEHAYALREYVVEAPRGIRILAPDESEDAVLSWMMQQ
jgi:hypothetical protein